MGRHRLRRMTLGKVRAWIEVRRRLQSFGTAVGVFLSGFFVFDHRPDEQDG